MLGHVGTCWDTCWTTRAPELHGISAKAVEEIGGGSWAFCMRLEAAFFGMLHEFALPPTTKTSKVTFGVMEQEMIVTEESEDRTGSSLENMCERIRGDAWPDW